MGGVPAEFKRRIAGASISTVGVAMLAIPLYDIWDDYSSLGWHLSTTLAENSVLIVLASALVGGGVWLTRQDWNLRYSLRVTKWSLGGTLVAAAVFGWIVALQLWVMGDLKPYIIALDGILVGAVATFVIGAYDARSEFRRDRLAAERDRLENLFANTLDGIALVRFGESIAVERTNERFEEFARGVDDPVEKAVAQFTDEERPEWLCTDGDAAVSRPAPNDPIETELVLGEGNGDRQFLGRIVPLDQYETDPRAYLVLTDVTEQKELAREREARERLSTLQRIASTMIDADDAAELREIVLEVVPETVDCRAVYVDWSVGEQAGFAAGDADVSDLIAETTRERMRAADDPGTSVTSVGEDELATVRIGDSGRLFVRTEGAFDETELEAVGLLATYTSRALSRLERESALEAERERLEFINRIVRHNLLNGLTVVKARTERLSRKLDGELGTAADTAHRRVEDMAELVDTMRQFTHRVVSDGDTHTELQSVDLVETLSRQVDRIEREYEARVTADLPDSPVYVLADELLDQVFENIFVNAVVHNDSDDPRIEVSLDATGTQRANVGEDDDTVTVDIADNGPGIPADERESVLEKGSSRLSDPESGFGLYLVAETVEAYDGDVEIADNDPRGTIISVTLRRA